MSGLFPIGASPAGLGASPTEPPGVVSSTSARYGALDGTAIADGGAYDAHTLRVIARGAQRLVAQGEPLLVIPFEADLASGYGENLGAPQATSVFGVWDRVIGPMSVPKKSVLRFAEGRLRLQAASGVTVYVQFCTSHQPFDPQLDKSHERIVSCAGTGSLTEYELSNLRLSSQEYESLEVWVTAAADQGGLINTATYGGINSGTVDPSAGDRLGVQTLKMAGVTWNEFGANTLANNNIYIYFLGSTGLPLVQPRKIEWMVDPDTIYWRPELSWQDWLAMRDGVDFELRTSVVQWLLASVSLYTKDWDGTI